MAMTQIQELKQINDQAIATQTAIMTESNRTKMALVMAQAKMDAWKQVQK